MMDTTNWYPVYIRESRYMGTYSGASWILTAGTHEPHTLDVFGGDVVCLQFWREHDDTGPFYEIGGRTVYIESGSDPTELYEEFMDRTS